MSDAKITTKCGSEKSVLEHLEENVGIAATEVDNLQEEKPKEFATASGDRALVLMHLENGLVGWENSQDPENPQYVRIRILKKLKILIS